MSGIGEEMGDVGLAIQRAEDKTAQMQARGAAIDELIASGALDDASQLNAGDDISRELDALSSGSDVEAELARLKAGSAPQAIEPAEDGGDILAVEPESVPAEGESSEGGRA
jgi:phage shock protein A